MADKLDFIITERAGFEVAGIRNPGVGATIKLTEKQAEQPLRTREIRRPGGVVEPAAEEAVDPLKKKPAGK